ncbi:hypothetical protein XZ42_06910 [Salmonella enterica subsp. diarizonae]|nr:hypothetical protein [Salmonella enterica subsp. diarizonae]EED7686837.1 hypothetical protein [Salmonella enterica subsp. enterica serovar Poona]
MDFYDMYDIFVWPDGYWMYRFEFDGSGNFFCKFHYSIIRHHTPDYYRFLRDKGYTGLIRFHNLALRAKGLPEL